MSSQTIQHQRNLSDGQFVADLTSLFKRRNISFGDPQDLERLAGDLAADDAFRAGLFNLCTVISHMGEVELTPRELLALVARASGGLGIIDAEGNLSIPQSAENAFLTGYEAWTHRGSDRNGFSESRHSDPFHTAMALSAAEGFRAPGHLPPPASPARPIPTNAPLDSLTLGELRQYLQEIERRVSQIEPHLEQMARSIAPPAMEFERPTTFERTHEAEAIAPNIEPAPKPDPALAQSPEDAPAPVPHRALPIESATPVVPVIEPVEAAEVLALAEPPIVSPKPKTPQATPAALEPDARPIVSRERQQPPIPDLIETSLVLSPTSSIPVADVKPDTARLRRLRTTNVVLAILLVISVVFAATVAFRYVNPRSQPAQPVATVDQDSTSPSEPASQPTPSAAPPKTPVAAVPHAPPPPAAPHPVLAASLDAKAPQKTQAPPVPARVEASTSTAVNAPAASPAPASAMSGPLPRIRTSNPGPDPKLLTGIPMGPGTGSGLLSGIGTGTAPNLAAVQAKPTGPVNVSGGVLAGMLLTPIQPVYPTIAKSARVQGTVVMEAVISKTGRIESLHAVSGPPMLRNAALEAVQAARYKPYRLSGEATEVQTTITVVFRLGN